MLYTQTSLSLVYNLERVSKSLQCYSATYQFGIVAWLRLEPNSYSTKLYSLHRRCSFGPVAVALGQLSVSFVLSAAFLLLGVVCQCTSPQLCTVCVVTCGEPSSSPNCVCAGRRSRPTTLFLSVLHWRVTLKLLLISFDCLIRRRTSPVCVVSVTTRGGVWRWTQPS